MCIRDRRRGFQDAIERLKDFRVAPLYKDIETLGSGEAVSYTHLDVYKRQLFYL